MSEALPGILYCHCKYAQVVPKEVKEAVLRALCESGVPFEAVADLCELTARKDPALQRLTAAGPLKIAACYPRAVKWLCAAGGAPLDPGQTEVLNMRIESAETLIPSLLSPTLSPNVPIGKETVARPNELPDAVHTNAAASADLGATPTSAPSAAIA